MGKFIPHASWMRTVPDNTRVTTLNIPGTHDSCATDGPLGFGKTQNMDLVSQLDAGIRFFDIRLAHYRDNLYVHHDVVHMGMSYGDVLKIFLSFLSEHPSETILMSAKNEGRFDSTLGRFAPSELFGKSRGNPANWTIRSKSFEDAFQARTWEHVEDPSLFYNFTVPIRERFSTNTLTSRTTLREVRGKIILLRRFEGGPDVGVDLSYWPENQRFRSAATLGYDVEDRYHDPGEDNKYNFAREHLEEARSGDPGTLYITFSSAVNLKAAGYAKVVNPRLSDYLARSEPARVGIIVMDYFELPQELVQNVIKMNHKAERPAVTPSR